MSPLSGVATMNRSDSSSAPRVSVCPYDARFRSRYRPLPEPPRSPWVPYHPVPSIPAPTTLRVPVSGFAIQGKLAHPPRRIAFTFVPGWSLASGPSSGSSRRRTASAYKRCYSYTGPPGGI